MVTRIFGLVAAPTQHGRKWGAGSALTGPWWAKRIGLGDGVGDFAVSSVSLRAAGELTGVQLLSGRSGEEICRILRPKDE